MTNTETPTKPIPKDRVEVVHDDDDRFPFWVSAYDIAVAGFADLQDAIKYADGLVGGDVTWTMSDAADIDGNEFWTCT